VSDHLVIITGKDSDEILLQLREHCNVTQSISKRVFLVQEDPAQLNVPKWKGLHIFSNPDIPEEILNFLDDKESLFVSAWRVRLQQPSKKRTGEGVSWDYPGFKPPR
jgi:hypothetical protein